MKQLTQLFALTILFFVFAVVLYSLVPFFAWIFYGSFKIVAQCPGYTFAFCVLVLPVLFVCFGNFFKNKF